MNILKNKYLLFVLRCVLAFVFIYAAVIKITDPNDFAKAISNYKLLPESLVNIFAIVLPWVEMCAGLLLLFGASVKENSAILSSMLCVFIVAIIISLARGLNINCGCFGTADGNEIGLTKLLQNIGLLIAGIILILYESDFLSISKIKSSHSLD